MKKLNYFLLGAAGLLLASCSQDDILNAPQGDGNYNITVKLPADMATRANGDGLQAQNLSCVIYQEDGTYVETKDFTFPANSNTTTVGLNLVQGMSYTISFFAQSPTAVSEGVYTLDGQTQTLTVNYDAMTTAGNNGDAYDCFYKLHETGVIGGSTVNTQVVLTRPIAKVNWGTSDLNEASVAQVFGAGAANLEYTLTTKAYSTLDLFNGEPGNQDDITVGEFGVVTGWSSYPAGDDYSYMAMQYLLAPTEEGIYDLNLEVNSSSAPADFKPITINVASAPVQANYQTNIYGALLTDQVNFNVEKNPVWAGEYDPSLELALKNGGTFKLAKDYDYSTPLVVSSNLVLDLNGHTITSNYGADGFILVNGGTLTITGDGEIVDGISTDNYQTLVKVTNGGTVNINGGSFTGYGEGQLIYVEKGTANVSGGTFELKDDPSGDNWCLNCYDPNYKNGTAKIYVTGGTFIDWNPQDNDAEGEGTDYVVAGYKVMSNNVNGQTYYTVLPDDAIIVSTDDGLIPAIENATNGATIYLTEGDFSIPNTISKDLTFIGLTQEATKIQTKNAYWNAQGASLTFENMTFVGYVNQYNHTSMGMPGAVNQVYNNVKFEGEFHVFTGDATFNDCDFVYDVNTGTNYQLWCQTSGTVDINNCTMECYGGKAILVYGWPGSNGAPVQNSVGGDININGLTVTNEGISNDKAVVEIHSEIYTKAGTININGLTYSPESDFGGGLWREINNSNNASTNFYTIYVNGGIVQQGGQTAN